MLNFKHLYYFYVFVTEGGAVKAAKRLLISQPALSAQLRQFEASLGVPLFSKAGRKLELTAKGRIVFSYASQMFALAGEMEDTVSAEGSPTGIRFTLGMDDEVPGPSGAQLIQAFAKFSQLQPQASLQFGEYDSLVEGLKSGGLDAILVNRPSYEEGVEILREVRMPVRLIAAPEFQKQWGERKQLLESNLIGLIKLFDIRFVLPMRGQRLRVESDRFLDELKASPRVALETNRMSATVAAVKAQMGVAFIPASYVSAELRKGSLKALGPKNGFWQHSLWLIGRRSERLSGLYQELGRTLGKLFG